MATDHDRKIMLDQLRIKLRELGEKYDDLVSYVRKHPGDDEKYPAVKELFEKMDTCYAKEKEQLQGEDSDWAHGFNSGVLAAVRLLGDYLLTDKEYSNILEKHRGR